MGLKIKTVLPEGGPTPRPRKKANIVAEKAYRKRRKLAASVRAKGKFNPDPTWNNNP
jgi:hypothetical protein